MSDKLLYHYEKELAFIQKSAGEFAKQHPSAAARLQLSGDTVDDPLVARLLSGFAFQNARIQQKLADDFPELTDALLETLYPHYLRPLPSMAVVQFNPELDLDAPARVDKNTLLETDSFQGQTCRFKSSYPVDIVPIKVDSAQLMPRPFIAPGSNDIAGASAVLKLSLKSLSPDLSIGEMGLNALRFFLRGQPQHVYPLYELLLTKCLRVVVAKGETDNKPVFLDPGMVQQVGFNQDEGLLPYPDSSFSGYRLLTEYFAFPEKFQFLDFTQLDEAINEHYGDSLNLYFYLTESDTELEHQIDASIFALGCTPVVNLFDHTADPIPLTHTESNYHIVPDARRCDGLEVYSVESAGATDTDGNYTPYRPFYGIQHSRNSEQQAAFWLTRRREVIEGEHRNEPASEMDISLVDLNFNPHEISDQTLDLKLVCSNRNLPRKLQTGQGQPYMQVVDGEAPAERISCVVNPTPTIRPPMRERGYWRLISHLNLNHLSLSNGGGSTDAIKEILRLYDFRDSASTRNMIESVLKMQTKSITAPIQIEGLVSLCRGTQIDLDLDPIMLSGTSPLIFASVLERFFGLYCSINSFTRLIVRLSGKDGELKRWPPRAGEKALI
ncbi:type VI secretion system baseplate subunit TssF [Agaribacterium sp. ZY112]|uniref:type VI secretion system baseplate subunit TssF n=1 Tax=Agaribacterium sp. ZY112 TaxID=3233574 RepID=UPI0035250AFD